MTGAVAQASAGVHEATSSTGPASGERPTCWVALGGFMGAGKSTVGRALAARLDAPFVDLDDRIAAEAGQSIPGLFEALGERGFRALEAQVLASVLAGPAGVLALGGGTVLSPENRAALRRAGVLVTLDISAETSRRRVGGSPSEAAARPLFAAAELDARLTAREAAYADCDLRLSAEADTPAVVDALLAALAAGLAL